MSGGAATLAADCCATPSSFRLPAGMGEVCDAYFRGLFQKIPNQPGVTVFQHIVALLRHADLARRKRLILTGHSLGAALAVVCTQSLHSWWVTTEVLLKCRCTDAESLTTEAECGDRARILQDEAGREGGTCEQRPALLAEPLHAMVSLAPRC